MVGDGGGCPTEGYASRYFGRRTEVRGDKNPEIVPVGGISRDWTTEK